MRVSPVGFAFGTVDDVLREAARSAEFTHNHPEGIKGAQATALAIFLARTAHDKDLIRKEISTRFDYDLGRTVDEIRPYYGFDETCQRTVPEAIISLPGVRFLRGCRPERGLARRRRRHAGLHHGRDRRGVLRTGFGRHREEGPGDPDAGALGDHKSILRQVLPRPPRLTG